MREEPNSDRLDDTEDDDEDAEVNDDAGRDEEIENTSELFDDDDAWVERDD